MNAVKRIATYSRVSTSNQEEQETIKAQTEALKEYSTNNGLTIIQEYKDEGWSGDSLARPALDRLREDARKNLWDGILIYDPDRLARRYSYQELVMDELREAGIEVMFITISAPKNSEDKILYGVRGLFAEYERTKIAERFRLGKLRKLKEGVILLSEPPYGYTYVKKSENTNGYLVINKEEANVVRLLFDWIINEKLSQRKIIRRLLELGIKPRKSKRGAWSSSTLSRLLRNEVYIGNAYWGKSTSVLPRNSLNRTRYIKNKKSSRKVKPKEDWYKVPVPAIVEIVKFNKVREILSENKWYSPRHTIHEYLLSGKVFCVCGYRRTGEGPQKGKNLYYRCSSKVHAFPFPQQCLEKTVNARIADTFVWDIIVELMTSKDMLLSEIEKYGKGANKEFDGIANEIALKNQQIDKLKEEELRFSRAYGTGIYTLETLQELIKPIRIKIVRLEKEISTLVEKSETHQIVKAPDERDIEAFVQKSKVELFNLNFSEKKAIILQTVEKVVVKQGQLIVNGAVPIPSNYVELCPNHRYGVSTIQNSLTYEKAIPFKIIKVIPMPKVMNVDYGFKRSAI